MTAKNTDFICVCWDGGGECEYTYTRVFTCHGTHVKVREQCLQADGILESKWEKNLVVCFLRSCFIIHISCYGFKQNSVAVSVKPLAPSPWS